MKKPIVLCGFLALAALSTFAQGTVLWDERVNGDLSTSHVTPTDLGSLNPGTYYVNGSSQCIRTGGNWAVDTDIFLFSVSANSQIQDISYFSTSTNANVWIWLGEPSFTTEMGFSYNAPNTNLVSLWNLGAINPGTYGMYVENGDHGIPDISYNLTFTVVPEPATLTLLGLGLGGLWLRRQRGGTSKP